MTPLTYEWKKLIKRYIRSLQRNYNSIFRVERRRTHTTYRCTTAWQVTHSAPTPFAKAFLQNGICSSCEVMHFPLKWQVWRHSHIPFGLLKLPKGTNSWSGKLPNLLWKIPHPGVENYQACTVTESGNVMREDDGITPGLIRLIKELEFCTDSFKWHRKRVSLARVIAHNGCHQHRADTGQTLYCLGTADTHVSETFSRLDIHLDSEDVLLISV